MGAASTVSPASALITASTPTGASTCSAGCVAGGGDERCRRALALAEAGAPEPRRRAVRPGPALGPEAELELADQLVRSVATAGDVLADVDDSRRAPVQGEERVERGDAVRVRRRHGQSPADVVERARADPADVLLDGMERRQQQVATLLRPVGAARDRDPPVDRGVARSPVPAGAGGPEQVVDRGTLRLGWLGVEQAKIHESILDG